MKEIENFCQKKNVKTNLLKKFVTFVDSTKKQNTCYKIFIFFWLVLYLCFYLFFKYVNEYYFSLDQLAKTGDSNVDLITREYKLDKMAKYVEIKSINLKLK